MSGMNRFLVIAGLLVAFAVGVSLVPTSSPTFANPDAGQSVIDFEAILFVIVLGVCVFLVHKGVRGGQARKLQRLFDEEASKHKMPIDAPLVWPPRRPDDWGWEIAATERAFALVHPGVPRTVPAQSIPSWEAHHRAEQDRDPLQIRWAQDETGEWRHVEWGNRGMRPLDGGPLMAAQAMRREDTGQWVWVNLGRNISLDWQRGPSRVERMEVSLADGVRFFVLRPLGSPRDQPAPPPMEPNDERGSSDWRSADDAVALGAVPPLRRGGVS